jgi:tetratricopeptide (TPR) repeat protein
VTRVATLVSVAVLLLACASSPPPPSSTLRSQALAAAEAGSKRFTNRHYAGAARSFGEAARIYDVIDDPEAQAAALRNQAEALRHLDDLDAATTSYERALTLDRIDGRRNGQARDLAGLARCFGARHELERAVRTSEQALRLVMDSEALRASLEVDLAVYLLARAHASDQARVVELLAAAAERATVAGEPRTLAAAHLHMGRARRLFGSPDLADAPLRQALSEFRALADPEGLARTHEQLGRLFEELGEPTAALRHLGQARRGYEFLDDRAALAKLDKFLAGIGE